VVKAPARQPYVIVGYKTPVIGNAQTEWESYALEMLSNVLDGGDSARLSSNLIRGSEVAAYADAGYDAFTRLPGMLLLDAIPTPGKPIEQVEKELRAEIERFKLEPVSEQELQRVRNQVIAAKVYEQDSVFYQAMQMGMLETIGLGWRKLDEYPERIRAITAEQVQAVARKYLVKDGLTVATLDPQPLNDKPLASAEQ
jgi:zinc protease